MAQFKREDFEPEIERVEEEFRYEADSGRVYTFKDPKAMKPDELFELDTNGAEHMVSTVVGDENYDDFIGEPEVDGYILDAIMTGWRKHYGMAVSSGNSRASRRRSHGTAKR